MEILDIVDENGIPTGETVERNVAHEKGIRHRCSHVWLWRRSDDGIEVLLQKRSMNKDSFPGCYDISSAGHIPAGVGFTASALRELKEELGITVPEEALYRVGEKSYTVEESFHGKMFRDNEFQAVFAVEYRDEYGPFVLQEEEVESVKWENIQKIYDRETKNVLEHCIDEIMMAEKHAAGQKMEK